ncbi:MAG: LCCL domain-containing protein [bacterium]
MIYGTGVYDHESPICKSGIHSGVIDNRGGIMTVKIGYPHKEL